MGDQKQYIAGARYLKGPDIIFSTGLRQEIG